MKPAARPHARGLCPWRDQGVACSRDLARRPSTRGSWDGTPPSVRYAKAVVRAQLGLMGDQARVGSASRPIPSRHPSAPWPATRQPGAWRAQRVLQRLVVVNRFHPPTALWLKTSLGTRQGGGGRVMSAPSRVGGVNGRGGYGGVSPPFRHFNVRDIVFQVFVGHARSPGCRKAWVQPAR